MLNRFFTVLIKKGVRFWIPFFVESFKKGEKTQADFWIKIRGDYILIQYFAVHDESGIYKGVIEVSQEISGIKALKGEKRLLDW